MLATYDEAMRIGVFPHEGGYTNDKADPGGPTNWGITIYDARLYWKKNATAADVRAMPKEVAEDIYAKQYAAVLRYNELPAGVDYSVLDYGINSGVGRAGKVLRRLVGLPDNTAQVTDEVIAAVNKRKPADLIIAINAERLRFLKSLKTWPVFGTGWGRRVNEVRDLSLSFAKQPIVPVLTNEPAPGKGHVAAPPMPVTQVAAKVAVPSAAVSGGVVHLIGRHPVLTTVIVGGVAVLIVGAAIGARKRHQAQQEAATPGIQPVAA